MALSAVYDVAYVASCDARLGAVDLCGWRVAFVSAARQLLGQRNMNRPHLVAFAIDLIHLTRFD